tara:strand:- start:64 stop:675 length:612 start_codon:yes stop_codon:yes gene_type:complete
MIRNKLILSLKVFLIYFIISLKIYAADSNSQNKLVVLGVDGAPIKIKVFSSFTCPHCANFHKEVIPKINKNYVVSGKVQIIFIDFPLDQMAFNASKLLHCLNQEKQIKFLDIVYETQNQWTSGTNADEINNNLQQIGKSLGINSLQYNKCLNDEAISDKILNGRIDGQKKYSIESTPTIIINEKKFKGSASFKNIKKEIEKLI